MKKILAILFVANSLLFCGTAYGVNPPPAQGVGYVNFTACVERSKQGQQEKNALEAMKKQMTDALAKTDKELEQIANELKDPDHLSPTAEEELKQKFQVLSQEYSLYQNQFYQLFNQASYKMRQTLHDEVSAAAEKVREKQNLLLILDEELAFAAHTSIDYTQPVIELMDKQFDLENPAAIAKE